jgi:hypothetical protein
MAPPFPPVPPPSSPAPHCNALLPPRPERYTLPRLEKEPNKKQKTTSLLLVKFREQGVLTQKSRTDGYAASSFLLSALSCPPPTLRPRRRAWPSSDPAQCGGLVLPAAAQDGQPPPASRGPAATPLPIHNGPAGRSRRRLLCIGVRPGPTSPS